MRRPTRNSSTLKIWRFLDGRPGHENQVTGLSDAISRTHSVEIFDVKVDRNLRGLRTLLPGRLSFAESWPEPDLLIGAGHSTHLPLLTCQRRFGGQTIVIMKPSLPVGLFDLCLIPAHDTLYFPSGNVIRTEGALNRVRPSTHQDTNRGLILVGGPSKHFLWSDAAVARQIQAVVRRHELQWTIATSERTPESFVRLWQSTHPEIPVVTPQSCDTTWLPKQLETSGVVWVTCDSMSMIYEALTAGSCVGLLELTPAASGRISANIQRLAELSLATLWSQWMNGRPLPTNAQRFSESDRCSAAVLDHFYSPASLSSPRRSLSEFLSAPRITENASPQLNGLESLVSGVRMPLR